MDKHAREFSKQPLSPDSYIPGYTGHLPQLKFKLDKPFRTLTAELLSSKARHSKDVPSGQIHSTESDADQRSILDSYLKRMTPGYTGFIPRSQHYFACSYSEASRKAMTEFHRERQEKLWRRSQDLPVLASYSGLKDDSVSPFGQKPKLPLKAISDEVFSYEPVKPSTPVGRPYLMADFNPHKYFITGYGGHVPQLYFLHGKAYPILTKEALIKFGEHQRHLRSKNIPESKNSRTPSLPMIHSSH